MINAGVSEYEAWFIRPLADVQYLSITYFSSGVLFQRNHSVIDGIERQHSYNAGTCFS